MSKSLWGAGNDSGSALQTGGHGVTQEAAREPGHVALDVLGTVAARDEPGTMPE